MTFNEWWETVNTNGLPNVARYRIVCKMAYEVGRKSALAVPEVDATEEELEAAHALKDYLLAHEDDIAACINDFAALRPVFVSVVHRAPSGPGERRG